MTRADLRRAPAGRAMGVLLVCVPGGGSRSGTTFDAHVPGADDFSFADAMTARGYDVALVDLAGVGEPEVDGDAITMAVAAARLADDVAQLRAGHDGIVVGVGHSLGAGVTARAQADFACFDAVALLGYSPQWRSVAADATRPTNGDVEAVRAWTAASLRKSDPPLWALDRVLFPAAARDGFAVLADVSEEVAAAAIADVVAVPRALAVDYGIPEPAIDAARRIRSPVLLVFGEIDASARPLAEADFYAAAPAVDTVVLPGSGHAHHWSSARRQLWERLDSWLTTTATVRGRSERTSHV